MAADDKWLIESVGSLYRVTLINSNLLEYSKTIIQMKYSEKFWISFTYFAVTTTPYSKFFGANQLVE